MPSVQVHGDWEHDLHGCHQHVVKQHKPVPGEPIELEDRGALR